MRGLAGLKVVASDLGRVLPESGADWPELYPLIRAEGQFGVEGTRAALAAAAASDMNIRRYLEGVDAARMKASQRRSTRPTKS